MVVSLLYQRGKNQVHFKRLLSILIHVTITTKRTILRTE